MTTTSLPNQIRIWLSQNTGFFSPAQIATAVGAERKSVSSALSRLYKADRIIKEGATYADPAAIAAQASQNGAEAGAQEPETDDWQPGLGEPEDPDLAERIEQEREEQEDLIGEPVVKFDLAKMKAKIAKLLVKAEKTDNDSERDAFNAAAERLMLKLGVQRAELESTGDVKPEEIIEASRDWHGNYSIVMVPFVYDVARGFGDLTVLHSDNSAMLRRTYVIGHKTDVEEFVTLIDSLALQAMSALRRWQKENAASRKGMTDMQKYVQHRSFLAGFGRQVAARLLAERQEEVAEASTGAALVLADKQSRITSWVDEQYPNVRESKRGIRSHDGMAVRDGRIAGQTANIGSKAVDSKKGELA